MASKRVLVAFLTQQSNNRTEQAEHKRKETNPNNQDIGRLRDHARLFAQAASICEASDLYGNGETLTDDQARHAEALRDRNYMKGSDGPVKESTISVNKVLQAEGNPLANSEREPLVSSPPTPKNKGGRPRKMTLAQINEANHGRAVARES